MKKSLVALATLAATGAVLAQATIYGRTDIGYSVKSASNLAGTTLFKQTIDELFEGDLAEQAKQRATVIGWTINSKMNP